ncbi:YceI family protein [Lysobacter korlensis]|uniref:YceI family protein n=1 Tax=Lysobacter korlensis TaxID=553636 RepID=A0ABV6S3M4_9GAMM
MSRLATTVLLALVAAPVFAGGIDAYTLDPVHTRVMFTVGHAGFSNAIGTVSGSTGTLHFEPDRWQDARLEVEVPMKRIDLGDARWNEATLAPRLLDAARHPTARFVSTHVDPVDATHAKVCGDLTLRGVTRPLCLDVTLNAIKRHPMPPFRRTAGFSATGALSRAEFGIDAWPSMIGDRVELRIEAEAVRSRGNGPDRPPVDETPADAPAPDHPDAGNTP